MYVLFSVCSNVTFGFCISLFSCQLWAGQSSGSFEIKGNPPFLVAKSKIIRTAIYLRYGFVLFIWLKKNVCSTKKVHTAVRFPTMSINHVSLFNQQRIFVTEKLLIQTALEQANPIKKNLHMFNYRKPCACNCASLAKNFIKERKTNKQQARERETLKRRARREGIKSLVQSLDNNLRMLNDMAFCMR